MGTIYKINSSDVYLRSGGKSYISIVKLRKDVRSKVIVEKKDWEVVESVGINMSYDTLEIFGQNVKGEGLKKLAMDLRETRLWVNKVGDCFVRLGITSVSYRVVFYRSKDVFDWDRYGVKKTEAASDVEEEGVDDGGKGLEDVKETKDDKDTGIAVSSNNLKDDEIATLNGKLTEMKKNNDSEFALLNSKLKEMEKNNGATLNNKLKEMEQNNDATLKSKLKEMKENNDATLSSKLKEMEQNNGATLSSKLKEMEKNNDATLSSKLKEMEKSNDATLKSKLKEMKESNDATLKSKLKEMKENNDATLNSKLKEMKDTGENNTKLKPQSQSSSSSLTSTYTYNTSPEDKSLIQKWRRPVLPQRFEMQRSVQYYKVDLSSRPNFRPVDEVVINQYPYGVKVYVSDGENNFDKNHWSFIKIEKESNRAQSLFAFYDGSFDTVASLGDRVRLPHHSWATCSSNFPFIVVNLRGYGVLYGFCYTR